MSIHQEFCKVNLAKTDYKIQSYAKLLSKEEIDSKHEELKSSVMPTSFNSLLLSCA